MQDVCAMLVYMLLLYIFKNGGGNSHFCFLVQVSLVKKVRSVLHLTEVHLIKGPILSPAAKPQYSIAKLLYPSGQGSS